MEFDKLRRIVTGHSADGKSVVFIDGPPGNLLESAGGGLAEIWNTDEGLLSSTSGIDPSVGPVVLSPPADGTKFRWFMIPPNDPNWLPEDLEVAAAAAFAAMGATHERPDTSRDPRMHKTQTIDYIILLSGQVTLLLDEDERTLKPFDVVVQRGTNHAWVNNGREPALLVAVLVGANVE